MEKWTLEGPPRACTRLTREWASRAGTIHHLQPPDGLLNPLRDPQNLKRVEGHISLISQRNQAILVSMDS